MSIIRHLAAFGLLLIVVSAANASGSQNPGQTLQEAKSLKCEFLLLATGTWTKAGEPQGEVKPTRLSLGFKSIDTQNGTADQEGVLAAPHVIVRFVGGYLHFMQVGTVGFLYTTTVFDKVNRPGKFKAVHTRHEYFEVYLPGFTSRPEQYYGECEVGQ